MERYFVLRVISKLLLPYILLFALYVQFHGDYGPGGGFQAGVIFAAGIILYTLVFGLPRAVRTFPPRQLELLMACGVLVIFSITTSCPTTPNTDSTWASCWSSSAWASPSPPR